MKHVQIERQLYNQLSSQLCFKLILPLKQDLERQIDETY